MMLTRRISRTKHSRQDMATVPVGDDNKVLPQALPEGILRTDYASAGWYYKHNAQMCGPFPPEQLQELLTTGRLQPRQAVWRQDRQRLLFVQAGTAAVGATGHSHLASLSDPVPA
jgi:hypothetical protein